MGRLSSWLPLVFVGLVGCGGSAPPPLRGSSPPLPPPPVAGVPPTAAPIEAPIAAPTAEVGPTADHAPRAVRRLARHSRYAPRQSGLTPAQRRSIQVNCPDGAPREAPSWGHGPTQIVARDGYALRHSAVDLIPLWVCEGVAKAQVDGPLRRPRNEPFGPDPEIPKGQRAELADYKRSGFDRGHMAPSADQTVDARRQAETFFLSNMAPQVGSGFNQHVWKQLEDKAREWIRAAGKGHIVTGPIFYDPEEDDPATADGQIEYTIIGDNAVAVPTHFYKIVVVTEGGRRKAIAFVFENRKHRSPHDWPSFIQSIDWIEERTGLDFMPDLNPVEQQRLESQPAAMW